jgi:membrane protein DedA with SNARE-associated domain
VITWLLDELESLDTVVVLVAMFFLAAGEAAFLLDLIVPGEVAMVVGGAVLEQKNGPIVAGMFMAAAGAVAGDSFSFWLGRVLGTKAVAPGRFMHRHFGDSIERARRYFEHRGGPVVSIARFIGALRAAVPFVAATSGMQYGRFLLWDVPAAIAWACLMVGLGAAFGDDIAATIDRLDWWVTLIVAGALVVWFVVHRVRARRRAEHTG